MSEHHGLLPGACHVLVTRPQQQGERLCKMIGAMGGNVLAFPVIETVAEDSPAVRKRLSNLLDECSGIIFVSRNAVRYCQQLLGSLGPPLKCKDVFVTGTGTRQELIDCGVNTSVFTSDKGGGGEALLALEQLSAAHVSGSSILIIRGNGGRELLCRELQYRGAKVHYAEVYRRGKPDISPQKANSIWNDFLPDVIVITSGQGLTNLVELTPERHRDTLFNTSLVVISSRLRILAGQAGFAGPVFVANSQSDDGLLQAITDAWSNRV